MENVARAIGFWLLAVPASYAVGAMLGVSYALVSTAVDKLRQFWHYHERGPRSRDAREVAGGTVATLLRELSRRAGIPTPHLFVVESPYANATSMSRDHRHASICVTTGLLNGLGHDELAAVLSHELAHVLQRSALIKTTAAAVSAALTLLPFVGPFVGLGLCVR